MRSKSGFDQAGTIAHQLIGASKQPTIAIIGGGVSGTLVAVHLLKKATAPLHIKLIERRSQLGAGMAYGTHYDCHLLNVPANKISAFPDDPNHFVRWLHQSIDRSLLPTAFVSRKLYGQYIQSLLQAAIAQAASEVRLEQITDEVLSIKLDGNRLVVFLRNGEAQRVDQAVLALGNLPPQTPTLANPRFYQSPRYIPSAWSDRDLSRLDPTQPVLLLGSGLTAVDVVLTLRQQSHRGPIHLVSRRGLLPRSHQATVARSIDWSELTALPLTTRRLVQQVRKQIDRAIEEGYDWRTVIDALRPQTQTLWQNLPLAEKQRFLRHVRAYWECHRHRMAPSIAQQIEAWLKDGVVQLHAARIQTCNEDATGVNVVMRKRGKANLQTLQVQAVINCTGPECNYRKSSHPLIMNLLNAELVHPDSLHLGLDVASNGALITAEGNPSTQLYTLGSLKKGLLWETTAVPEIREQAETLAEELLVNVISTISHKA